MAHPVDPLSAGESFSTFDAPYLKALSSLPNSHRERSESPQLRQILSAAVNRFLVPAGSLSGERQTSDFGDCTVAEVLDIKCDPHDQKKSAVVTASLQESELSGNAAKSLRVEAANKFFSSLRNCASDVHTRIVILQQCMTDIALESLLFSQILGAELDLQPSQVAVLAQIPGLCVDSPPLQYLDRASNIVFFGPPNVFEQRRTDVAEYVGLGKMETTSNSPHIGRHKGSQWSLS